MHVQSGLPYSINLWQSLFREWKHIESHYTTNTKGTVNVIHCFPATENGLYLTTSFLIAYLSDFLYFIWVWRNFAKGILYTRRSRIRKQAMASKDAFEFSFSEILPVRLEQISPLITCSFSCSLIYCADKQTKCCAKSIINKWVLFMRVSQFNLHPAELKYV